MAIITLMNAQQKIDFKNTLKQQCVEIIKQRIASSHRSMENAQMAANEEEKSSVGDKYETGRAMNHIEKDMHAKQLSVNKKDMAGLLAVNCDEIYQNIKPGCFVKCTGISFFIAACVGKITIEEETVFLLSPHAPFVKMLYNKKAGSKVLFNGKEFEIEDIF